MAPATISRIDEWENAGNFTFHTSNIAILESSLALVGLYGIQQYGEMCF